MSESDYVEVPVTAARHVAHAHAKDVVVIVAWDEAHNRVHTTTYGRDARHKGAAAKLGEILTSAAGCDLAEKVDFEDFRTRTQAEWAAERERLLARIRELEAASGK